LVTSIVVEVEQLQVSEINPAVLEVMKPFNDHAFNESAKVQLLAECVEP
jgi:hypothetical protein